MIDRCRPFRLRSAIVLAAVLPCASLALAGEIPLSERKSGYAFMSRESQAMQDDDATNPGMLWVLEGESLWNSAEGAANKSCADCHGDGRLSMKGVAARYPAFDPARSHPVGIAARINICRTEQQKAAPLAPESKPLLAMSAYVGLQSRGMPITVAVDGNSERFFQDGRTMFVQRQGQLNLSCAQCHDDNWGQKLAGAPIPQGHATGYPLYRLEWQSLGSLQRRLRNCLIGMRAEAYPLGAPEYVALELYLMWRARGMKVETPAVRP
jgi:sulfur-oxidizing protein SoxA